MMKLVMALSLTCLFALSAGAGAQESAASGSVPKFKDYPVKTIFKGKPAKPRLKGDFERYYGHHYTSAAKEGVTFAGHYTIVTRTCGTTCVIVDILNLKTGGDVQFDFVSISGWREYHDAFEPITVKPDSRLIVFAGARNEKAPLGYHYYVLEKSRLKFLRTVETDGNFMEPLSKE